jgi:two-component system chemotaxis response regulator CheB
VATPEKSLYDGARIVLRNSPTPPRLGVLAIGSSTGGPQALLTLFEGLKYTPALPIVITQHMPPTFTAIMAEQIEKTSGIPSGEAKEGETVKPGHVYVAPGNYHMTVVKEDDQPVIRINQGPPENFCRPAVDPMLRSLVEVYGGRTLVVILTGMGQDGLRGCQSIVESGGVVLAQDEASSVVWGMPGAVATAGVCREVLPIDKIGPRLASLLRGQGL